jgi:hypothetical protein
MSHAIEASSSSLQNGIPPAATETGVLTSEAEADAGWITARKLIEPSTLPSSQQQ